MFDVQCHVIQRQQRFACGGEAFRYIGYSDVGTVLHVDVSGNQVFWYQVRALVEHQPRKVATIPTNLDQLLNCSAQVSSIKQVTCICQSTIGITSFWGA